MILDEPDGATTGQDLLAKGGDSDGIVLVIGDIDIAQLQHL